MSALSPASPGTGTSSAASGQLRTGAMGHIPSLDGLRGLAVIGVLLFHGGYLVGGFLGVDLFFALSGFLITRLLVREAERSSAVDLIGFWGRRFRRLLPAVLVLLVVVMLWARWFGSPDQWATTLNDAPWAQFYLANWHQIGSPQGYWDSFADPPLFGHLWSLAIEEQFYVLWPLVVMVVWRLARRGSDVLLAICLAGAGLSFLAMALLFDGGDPTRVYMGTDTRASSILVGAAFGTRPAVHAVTRAIQSRPHLVDLTMVLAIAVIGLMWFTVDGASSEVLFRGGLLAHSTLAAIVVAFAAVRRGWITKVLGSPVLQWFGRLSYSLYLWHWPVYVVLNQRRTGIEGLQLLGVRLSVSLVLAVVSYHLVEEPLRRKVSWTQGSVGRWVFLASMVAVALLWVATPHPVTEVSRFDPNSITAPSGPTTETPIDDTTSTSTEPDSSTPVVRTVIWDGDSLAYDQAPAVVAALGAAGVTVVDTSQVGGRLVPNADIRDPFSRITDGFRAAPVDQAVDLVVHQLSVWDALEDPGLQAEALERLWDITRSEGAILMLVTPPVVAADMASPGMADLVANARGLSGRSGGGVELLDQSGVFGDVFVRDVDSDGVPERKPDGVHLCPSGAARIAAWLVPELAARFSGISPVQPVEWVDGPWVVDPRFDDPPGACMGL